MKTKLLCTKCKQEKDSSEFFTRKTKRGFHSWCKQCMREYNNLPSVKQEHKVYCKKHYKENQEYLVLQKTEYRTLHRKEVRESWRKYYQNNKEKRLEKNHNYYRKHRKRLVKQKVEYGRTEQGKITKARSGHKRRSRLRNTPCTLNVRGWKYILDLQNNRCDDCKREFTDDLIPVKDHIIPLSNIWCYGLTKGNVKALCVSCNGKKYNHTFFARALTELL